MEGGVPTGKTTLCAELVRKLAGRARVPSIFHFRQTHTYHPLNPDHPASTANETAAKKLLDDLLDQMRRLAEHEGFILLETLHWTLAQRPGIDDATWLARYEAALAALGAKVVLVRASAVRQRAQLHERTDTEFFSLYGRKYGATEAEVTEYYLREAECFDRIASASDLSCFTIDTSAADSVDQVMAFWVD